MGVWLSEGGSETPPPISALPPGTTNENMLSGHAWTHTHTGQGDRVKLGLQAVVVWGVMLSRAASPVEDSLIVVERLRVAQGVHFGACLEADTM